MNDFVLFGGTAHPELATSVAHELSVRLGACRVKRFPDGEVSVQLLESVRGKEVFVMQPTSPPVNDHLMELLAWADVCRRSAAARVTAIVPYFGYARADKRNCRREPITASMVATIMQASGIDHVLTLDLHTPQVEGFFHIPVDTLTAVPTLCDALRERLPEGTVVVSPDAGRVRLATEYAERLRTPLVVLHKRRASGTETQVTHVVGEVQSRPCLLVDDMISTGGTLVESARALRRAGARSPFWVVATHGLLLNGALNRLVEQGVHEVWVTDTIQPVQTDQARLRIVSVAPLIARAIQQFMADGSLAEL